MGMTDSSRERYGRRLVPASEVRRTKADSDEFDALAVPFGLMVRSRDLRAIKIPQPRARRLEPWGRPILRDGRYATIAFLVRARSCALLRMRRIRAVYPVTPILSSGNRFSKPTVMNRCRRARRYGAANRAPRRAWRRDRAES